MSVKDRKTCQNIVCQTNPKINPSYFFIKITQHFFSFSISLKSFQKRRRLLFELIQSWTSLCHASDTHVSYKNETKIINDINGLSKKVFFWIDLIFWKFEKVVLIFPGEIVEMRKCYSQPLVSWTQHIKDSNVEKNYSKKNLWPKDTKKLKVFLFDIIQQIVELVSYKIESNRNETFLSDQDPYKSWNRN